MCGEKLCSVVSCEVDMIFIGKFVRAEPTDRDRPT